MCDDVCACPGVLVCMFIICGLSTCVRACIFAGMCRRECACVWVRDCLHTGECVHVYYT